MPTIVKTYDGTGDPEDHLKTFTTSTWLQRFKKEVIGSLPSAEEGKERSLLCPQCREHQKQEIRTSIATFIGDKGHNTDDCLHLRRQIKEAVKSGQLAHLVNEIKYDINKASTSKAARKPDSTPNDKGVAIFMVHSWGRNVRPWMRSEVRSRLVSAIVPLIGFLGEISWPLGKIILGTQDPHSRSGLIYRTWDDEISNEGESSHNRERKSQTAGNSNGASTSHFSPKSIKC
ncbi:hypothetical protein Tco_0919225 [Tanacetum coccineum]